MFVVYQHYRLTRARDRLSCLHKTAGVSRLAAKRDHRALMQDCLFLLLTLTRDRPLTDTGRDVSAERQGGT